MSAQCGSSAAVRKKKISPDTIYAWVDEETFIDVKKQQLKRRRSTSTPPSVGRKTHHNINTNNYSPSLEVQVASDKELKKASKRSNVPPNGPFRGCQSSAATTVEDRIKLYETNKSMEKRKSMKKVLAMGKRISRMQQQQFATEKGSVVPSSPADGRNLAVANSGSCENLSLEETLASVSQCHYMHFAADKKLRAPKKKRDDASLNDTSSIRGRPKAVPSFWQQSSSDKALDIASAKGKRLRENRREKQLQHQHHRQQIERKKWIERKVRNTPLSGISSSTFDILPSGPLKHVASYLAAPSRVLFDIALYGMDIKPCSSISSGLAGNQWDVLDFGDIEKDLAYNLRDRHIKAILLCIDAVNNVKRLRLTNCFAFTGAGLEPLRDSRVIEQIDLGIVSNRTREWGVHPTPQIVYEQVVPILDSIIEGEGCALKHLQFPKLWRNDDDGFLARYNEMLRRRGRICCFKCKKSSYPKMVEVVVRRAVLYRINQASSRKVGQLQSNTCSNCLNHFCGVCRNEEQSLRFCGDGCGKNFCSNCTTFNTCDSCKKESCANCETFFDCCSSHCDRKICSGCILKNTCEKCRRSLCSHCEYSGRIKLHNMGVNERVQCTRCLCCTGCGDCIDSVYPSACARCYEYFCESCFQSSGHFDEHCDMDEYCGGCREEIERFGHGHGRHIVYGDAFTNAPICDM
jgi:hypothetical protein